MFAESLIQVHEREAEEARRTWNRRRPEHQLPFLQCRNLPLPGPLVHSPGFWPLPECVSSAVVEASVNTHASTFRPPPTKNDQAEIANDLDTSSLRTNLGTFQRAVDVAGSAKC